MGALEAAKQHVSYWPTATLEHAVEGVAGDHEARVLIGRIGADRLAATIACFSGDDERNVVKSATPYVRAGKNLENPRF
jgi:hypothetical protein